jgi:hypothetical protein
MDDDDDTKVQGQDEYLGFLQDQVGPRQWALGFQVFLIIVFLFAYGWVMATDPGVYSGIMATVGFGALVFITSYFFLRPNWRGISRLKKKIADGLSTKSL